MSSPLHAIVAMRISIEHEAELALIEVSRLQRLAFACVNLEENETMSAFYRDWDFWFVDRSSVKAANAVTCYCVYGSERNPNYRWICDLETIGM